MAEARSRQTERQPDSAEAPWHALAEEELFERLDASREGLDGEEARRRLERHGPNTFREDEGVSPWRVLLDQVRSPLIYVLIGALAVTLSIQSWGDAIVIGLVLLVNTTVGFFQEYRAETAVRALMEMVSPRARVLREGEERELESRELVPGDVVLLEQGRMVPADARLLEASSLQVDEAALTGESVPVSKRAGELQQADEELAASEQENMVFLGTAVTAGKGRALVVATGEATEVGRIARDVREAGAIETPLQERMRRLAKWIAGGILAIAAIAFGVGLLMGRGLEDTFLLAVALAVAAMPAGLPVVMTVALAVGVRRMARRHAVIRHLPAVETLGSTTTILADKTGTLTQNRMTLRELRAAGERLTSTGEPGSPRGELRRGEEPAKLEEESALWWTLIGGVLANDAELGPAEEQEERDQCEPEREEPDAQEGRDDADGERLIGRGDAMEVALLVAGVQVELPREELERRFPRRDEVPFETERRYMATIHDGEDGDGPLVLAKGAPETMLGMCSRALRADGSEGELEPDRAREEMEAMAAEGLRVLAVARGRGEAAVRAVKEGGEGELTLCGLVGLMDPPREEAVQAIDDCHRAGIRVVMVTGDHAATAAAIAHQVHIDRPVGEQEERDRRDGGEVPEARVGRDIADLEDEELAETMARTRVFARIEPREKLRLVRSEKARGAVVAVTGDGVNDAPALKSAHIGAAMGSGTDVAKEASDMVITDDDFASVYAAVQEGRTAFRNIRMATFFLLSTGAADVLIILSALVAGWPLPLLPAQILWCNVVTNGIADVALGFEPGERGLYERPPRPPEEGVLDRALIERLVVVGIWLAAGTLGVFLWKRGEGDLTQARSAALTALVLFQKVHVFNCRSEDQSVFHKSLLANKVLLVGVLTSLAVHVAALHLSWTQQVLDVEPLAWSTWAVLVPVAASAILVNELHKRLRPRKGARPWSARPEEPNA